MTTLCVNCRFHIALEQGTPRKNAWYNHLCGASPLPSSIDPVTGEETHTDINDLGNEVSSEHCYQFCNRVNTGNCPLYEEAPRLTYYAEWVVGPEEGE